MPEFPSEGWVRAWVDLANHSKEFESSGAGWEGAVGVVIEPDAAAGVTEPFLVRLEGRHGKWQGCAFGTNEALLEATVFVLRAPYRRWKEVVSQELHPIKALLQGKIRVQGHLPVILKWTRSMIVLGQLAGQVDTTFIDERGRGSPPRATAMEPETRYARSGGVNIAYRVFGEGPVDIVMVPGFISHVEYAWREPSLARFLRKLSAFSRVIAFDKRGMGLSDRSLTETTPTLDERIDDVRAVMDAAHADRAGLFAWSEGGPLSILFAAIHHERIAALVLVGTTPRFPEAPDFPQGIPTEVLELAIESWQEEWGTGVGLELYGPSVAHDDRVRTWWAAYQRFAATPGAVAASLRLHLHVDVRHVLPRIKAPTLILHRVDDMLVPVTCARYMAQQIPGARYLELPGTDHMYWLGDQEETLAAIRSFLAETAEGTPIKALRRRRRRPSIGWESLTEAELDVVRLVTEGLTNQEIATRLYVSPRTVQTHLAHVFAKLGVSRRSEVAAEASRRLR